MEYATYNNCFLFDNKINSVGKSFEETTMEIFINFSVEIGGAGYFC